MLSDQELTELLNSRESSRVERKESFHAEESKKVVCAFANDLSDSRLPGVLFIGVKDDGTCANMQISDELLLRIGELRADGSLLPSPVIEIEEKTLAHCRLIVVQVRPHGAPPVMLRGRAYVRVGPRIQQASSEEERVLNERRRGRDLSFDLRPVDTSSIEDLDRRRFNESYLRQAVSPEVLSENQRSEAHRMISLRILDPAGLPTAGGILIVGNDPERFIPGAYVQYNRFDGLTLADPIIDTKRISGPLDQQLLAIDDILKLSIKVEVDITHSDREIRIPDYPLAALQQLARNAIMHRNYQSNSPFRISWFSDRVEFQSPGGLFGQVTEENFGSGVTDYRNPLVAEGMKNFGFVQKFGVGVVTAQASMAKNGNPDIEFQFSPASFAAIARSRP